MNIDINPSGSVLISLLVILLYIVVIMDYVLNLYFFTITNKLLGSEEYSWNLLLLYIPISLIGRLLFLISMTDMLISKIETNLTLTLLSIIVLIELLVIPLLITLGSISKFIINRNQATKKTKLIIIIITTINLVLALLTLLIITYPIIAFLLYRNWGKSVKETQN